MDEKTFKAQLASWKMNVRDTIVPTSGKVKLYGQNSKTKIIPSIHEHLIYTCVKPLNCSDELYDKLINQMKMDDNQVLEFLHTQYDQYLKDLRRQIITLQKTWSKGFAQNRAKIVMEILGFSNIFHICDLAIERIVPIELVLKIVFNVSSNYGEHRRIKEKAEIYMDPRVLKTYNDLMKAKESTIIHSKNN